MSVTFGVKYIGDATITMAIDGTDPEMSHKSVIRYAISLPIEFGGRVHTGSDLSVVTRDSDDETLTEAYRSLMSFLGASAEAYRTEMSGRDSENGDLFPIDVKEWADNASDEISIESMEDDEDSDGWFTEENDGSFSRIDVSL